MAYEDILKALLGDQDGLFSGTPLLAKSDTINPVYSAAQKKAVQSIPQKELIINPVETADQKSAVASIPQGELTQPAVQRPNSKYWNLYDKYGKENNIPPEMLRAFSVIESGERPGVTTGSYRGHLQLSPSEFRRYGGTGDIYDVNENIRVGSRKLRSEMNDFAKKYGREPTAAELYLIHQQGTGGYDKHSSNPDQPAWLSMYQTGEGQQKGQGWAKRAIWGNVPDRDKKRFGSVDNITSKDFMNLWTSRVEKLMGGKQAAPTAVAQQTEPPIDPAKLPDNVSSFSTRTVPEGMMSLGGPKPEDAFNTQDKPIQLAQAQAQAPTSKEYLRSRSATDPVTDTKILTPPAFQMSEKDLWGFMHNPSIPMPEKMRLIEQIHERNKPVEKETGLGTVQALPGNQQGNYVPGKAKEFPLQQPQLVVVPDGKGGFRAISSHNAIEGGIANPSSLDAMKQAGQLTSSMQQGQENYSQASTVGRQEIGEAVNRGYAANKEASLIGALKEIGDSKGYSNIFKGPLSPRITEAIKGIEGITGANPLYKDNQLSIVDFLNTATTRMATMGAKDLTNRPTQFDYINNIAASPGILNTEAGFKSAVDWLDQTNAIERKLSDAAYRVMKDGKQADWTEIRNKIIKDNMPVFRVPSKDGKMVPLSEDEMKRQIEARKKAGLPEQAPTKAAVPNVIQTPHGTIRLKSQ